MIRVYYLLLALVASCGMNLQAQENTPHQAKVDELFQQLVSSCLNDDYDSFVAHGTPGVKAGLSKTQVDALSSMMAPNLKAGYNTTFLGELNKQGFQVYVYRLRFKNSSDDVLAVMSLKDGQVGGIYFK